MSNCTSFRLVSRFDLVRCAVLMLVAAAWGPVSGGEIHDAACDGNLEKVKALLTDNPAEVNAKDESGYTPMHCARVRRHKEVVELLLAHGAVEDAFDVAARGDLTKLKALLKANPALSRTKEKDPYGETLLHLAASEGHTDVAELLLAQKADVNAKDIGNGTPLHWAAGTGNKDVAELLLANKAKVNTKVTSCHCDGWTPLHCAVSGGFIDVVELLLVHHAQVNAKSNQGLTPLHLAASHVHQDMAELLLAHKAKVKAKSKDGWTPLHEAACDGHMEMAELLLAHKAKLNARTKDGSTPLDTAVAYHHEDLAALLRQHGAHE